MTDTVPHWMKLPSGYFCARPVEFEFQGEMFRRDCGWCARCIAKKKRDLTGRAAAEAATSAEVVALTLTYRDGEPGAKDFVTLDRQQFLYRLRSMFRRKAWKEVGRPKRCSPEVAAKFAPLVESAMVKVRYIGCGERGKRSTKRCHWHLCLFLSRPSGWVSTPKDRDGRPGREHIREWPHGFVNIHVLPEQMDERLRAVRYVTKYLDKARDTRTIAEKLLNVPVEAKLFRSQGRFLGADYLLDWARQVADAGLPFDGKYRVPGLRFTRGQNRHTDQVLVGVARGHVIAEYRRRWRERYGERDVPMTDFMLRFDDEAFMPARHPARRVRFTAPRTGVKPFVLPDPFKDRSGVIAVDVYGKGNVGVVDIHKNGFARWVPREGPIKAMPNGDLRGIVNLDEAAHAVIAEKVAKCRGEDWLSRDEYLRRKEANRVARLAALSSFAKMGPKVVSEWQVGRQGLTHMFRKFRMNEWVDPGGAVVPRPLPWRRNDRSWYEFKPENAALVVPVVLRRPRDGILWDMPHWMRRAP